MYSRRGTCLVAFDLMKVFQRVQERPRKRDSETIHPLFPFRACHSFNIIRMETAFEDLSVSE